MSKNCVTYKPGNLDSCFPLLVFFVIHRSVNKILFECSKLLSVGPQGLKRKVSVHVQVQVSMVTPLSGHQVGGKAKYEEEALPSSTSS